MLIICVITLKLTQPIQPQYINIMERQMNRQIDGQLPIAKLHFALCASHGKKVESKVNHLYNTQIIRLTQNTKHTIMTIH